MHLSPDSLLVAAKVAVRADDSAATVVRGIDAAESRVRAALPIARVIYLEPDIYQESRADQTDPAIRVVQRAWDDSGGTGPQRAITDQHESRALTALTPGLTGDRPNRPGVPARRLPTGRYWPGRCGRPSSRSARSCSKSRARPGRSGSRPRRRLRSATAARTAGSESTRKPNATDAGLTW